MRVAWTARAEQRPAELYAYLAQNSSQVADQVRYRLLVASGRLATLPYSGRKVEEYNLPDIRELHARPYRIIYRIRVDRDRVDVLVVRHYRELLPSDMAKL